MICFTFALAQDGSKSSLKKRLLKYHRGQFTSVNGAPAPTPRKMFALKSQKSDQPILFIIDQLRKSDQRFMKSSSLLPKSEHMSTVFKDYAIQVLRTVVNAVYGWSDSQITLAWFMGRRSDWKVIVENSLRYSPTSSTKPVESLSRKSKSSRPGEKENSCV